MCAAALIVPLAVCGVAVAQPEGPVDPPAGRASPQRFALTLYFENDGTFTKANNPTDRHETANQGFSLAFQPDFAREWAEALPRWESRDPLFERSAFGIITGLQIFTPEELTLADPDPDDRPYAGYLFAGAYLQRVLEFDDHSTLDHLQLDLGVIGPSSQADDTQKTIHDIFDEIEPAGWDSQLDDEVTFQFTYTKKWRFTIDAFGDLPEPWGLEAIPAITGRAGTVHVDLRAGAILRFGINLDDDFGPGFLTDPPDATGPITRGFMMYVFGGGSVRFVAHDVFLEGGTFRSGPSVDAEPVVGDLTLGAAIGYRRDNFGAALNYAQRYTSREFETQRGTDALGRLSLTLRWEF